MKRITACTAVAVAMFTIAACDGSTTPAETMGGGKADAPDDPGGPTSGSDDPYDGSAATECGALDQSPGEVLFIASAGNFGKFNGFDPNTETFSGWEIDYLDALMDVVGRPYQLVQQDWGRGCCEVNPLDLDQSFPPDASDSPLFHAVHAGAFDLAVNGISDSDRRVPHFATSVRYGFLPAFVNFTFPSASASEFDFGRRDWWAALEGKTLGVSGDGTNQMFYLRLLRDETGVEFDIVDASAHLQVVGTTDDGAPISEDPTQALARLLQEGAIDAAFGSALVADADGLVVDGSILDIDHDRFERVWGTGATVFMPPDVDTRHPGLREAIDCAIEQISQERPELYAELRQKHGTGLCNPTMTRAECEAFTAG